MNNLVEPERVDYGPPVGVVWEAKFKVGDIEHNISSPDKEVAEHLIQRLLAGDSPGGV